jgi:chorismate mutase/prephenate dehydratase
MISVAIQGIAGSYSEEAAGAIVPDARVVECREFHTVFAAVESGSVDYGVVPIENKIVGSIRRVDALLNASVVRVLDSCTLSVDHVLAGTADSDLACISGVVSHPEALKQCSLFFRDNPAIRAEPGADTASSIRRVLRDGNKMAAAIGSRRAAELYAAKVLLEDIADESENWTKFYLIGK